MGRGGALDGPASAAVTNSSAFATAWRRSSSSACLSSAGSIALDISSLACDMMSPSARRDSFASAPAFCEAALRSVSPSQTWQRSAGQCLRVLAARVRSDNARACGAPRLDYVLESLQLSSEMPHLVACVQGRRHRFCAYDLLIVLSFQVHLSVAAYLSRHGRVVRWLSGSVLVNTERGGRRWRMGEVKTGRMSRGAAAEVM